MSLILTDIAVRRQVLLERFKAAEVRKFTPILRKIDEEIRRQLSGNRLTDFRRARLEQQLASLKTALGGHYQEFGQALAKDLEALAIDTASFEKGMLATYAPKAIASPGPQQLWAAVTANPLTMTGANGGQLLESFMASWADGDAEMVSNAVRMGYALGETNDQIIARIRGDAALNFSDGVLAKSRSHAEAVTRTAIQHVANSARAQVWEANDDIIDEYQWVSTLDSRTTPLCRDRDGQKFPVGKGPLPPAHPNCRSTTVAVIKGEFGRLLEEESNRAAAGGPVPAGETYYDWLKRQPHDFQDLALGPTRGKLFRDGGLSTEQFSKLQLGKNFEPMTLADMKMAAPNSFIKAGILDGPPVPDPVPLTKLSSLAPAKQTQLLRDKKRVDELGEMARGSVSYDRYLKTWADGKTRAKTEAGYEEWMKNVRQSYERSYADLYGKYEFDRKTAARASAGQVRAAAMAQDIKPSRAVVDLPPTRHFKGPEDVGEFWLEYENALAANHILEGGLNPGQFYQAGFNALARERLDEAIWYLKRGVTELPDTELVRGAVFVDEVTVRSLFPEGGTIRWDRFTSFTKDRSIADQYMDPQFIGAFDDDPFRKVLIRVSRRSGRLRGTRVQLTADYKGWDEVLMPPGSEYFVKEYIDRGDYLEIVIEQLTP